MANPGATTRAVMALLPAFRKTKSQEPVKNDLQSQLEDVKAALINEQLISTKLQLELEIEKAHSARSDESWEAAIDYGGVYMIRCEEAAEEIEILTAELELASRRADVEIARAKFEAEKAIRRAQEAEEEVAYYVRQIEQAKADCNCLKDK